MPAPKVIPGKFVWFELATADPKKAQSFYADVLGWKVAPFSMGDAVYEMIDAGGTTIGGYTAPPSESPRSHWISYVSVEDVDAAAKATLSNGGKLLEAPYDIPNVGRTARIADPTGAELYLFRSDGDDKADAPTAPPGTWIWNELHTTDPAGAIRFYEKVIGYSVRSMDMGAGGVYHVLSHGGVGRGGVSGHLPAGVRPHWLPYVSVEDVDRVIATAQGRGASIPMTAEDIPGVGRIAILVDPTGAALALLKPVPMERPASV